MTAAELEIHAVEMKDSAAAENGWTNSTDHSEIITTDPYVLNHGSSNRQLD